MTMLSAPKAAVLVFPGSNCDSDCKEAITHSLNWPVDFRWYQDDTSLLEYDLILLPGGFSYGDYLRCGALAKQAPVMKPLKEAAQAGRTVVGICNGFQILTEAGLLPGALVKNKTPGFWCERQVSLTVEQFDTPVTRAYQAHPNICLPVAHGEGCFVADEATLNQLEATKQVVFRYATDTPNGSMRRIAGICNETRNVIGLMPHPERMVRDVPSAAGWHQEGLPFFKSLALTSVTEAL
jgi:phosphoribosylformylglycinamidine synthase subunit PurQ / glutaminase